MSDVNQVAAPFEVILLRQRVKQLEDEIQQLTSVSFEDECEEWKKSLAEARAEGAAQAIERAGALVCTGCSMNLEAWRNSDGSWWHKKDGEHHSFRCQASGIREANKGDL